MPEENSVQQLNLWRHQEKITACHLNEMVRAINFLLKTVGYLHNRTALSNYEAPGASHKNYPGIIEKVTVSPDATTPHISYGNLILPPFGQTPSQTPLADYNPATNSGTPGIISGIKHYEDISAPDITDGEIHLPVANSDPSSSSKQTGSVHSVAYDNSQESPCIQKGKIILNPADASNPGFISGIELSESSSIPDIYKGVIRIPPAYFESENFYDSSSPGYIQKISYDESRTSPAIHQGNIKLNPANYTPGNEVGTPGYISKVEIQNYDPSNTSVSEEQKKARIDQGKIIIPLPQASTKDLSIENVSCMGYSAAPGVDGWVQTMIIHGSYQNGSLQYRRDDRQLMRIKDNKLQVIQQISYDGYSWSDAS